MHRIETFAFTRYRDLENRVWGHSRSLEMTPLDRSYMTSSLCSIETMALVCTLIFDILDIEKYCDLEIEVRGHSGSSKLIPFYSLPTVFN